MSCIGVIHAPNVKARPTGAGTCEVHSLLPYSVPNRCHPTQSGVLMSFSRACNHAVLSCSLVIASIATSWAQNATSSQSSRSEDEKRSYRTAMEQADQKIADEVKTHSELVKNLEYLTTQIGARLTGSPQMNRASEWTLQRFKDYGIDAHLETTEIEHGWTRGPDTAEITAPITKSMQIRSLGLSKATNGPLSGNVVFIEAKTPADLEKYKGKLKGAIVMASTPADVPPDSDIPENAYDAVIPPSHGVPKAGEVTGRQRFQMLRTISQEGVGAVLLDSGKTDSLFNMGGGFGRYNPSEVPLAFL